MLVTSRDRAVGVTGMGLGRDAGRGRKECAIQMPPISTGCNPPRVPACHGLAVPSALPSSSAEGKCVASALQLQGRVRQSPMGIGQSSSEKRLRRGGGLVNWVVV